MTISVAPLVDGFVAELTGLDLQRTPDGDELAVIVDALAKHGVLVIRGRLLTIDEQIRFARLFGPLETAVGAVRRQRQSRFDRDEVVDVSNLKADGQLRNAEDSWRLMQRANQLWHTDSSFKAIPGKYSFLHAHSVPPEGGDTEFADLRAAFDALDADTRACIVNLNAEHSMMHSRQLAGFNDYDDRDRAAYPPVSRPLVRSVSESARTSLYLASHASHIIGWPVSEGRKLLDELTRFATQQRFVYRHSWRVGDLVVWDNRCTMHRALPYDDQRDERDMRRITVQDIFFDTGREKSNACSMQSLRAE